jgi:regulator of replication initiation timing
VTSQDDPFLIIRQLQDRLDLLEAEVIKLREENQPLRAEATQLREENQQLRARVARLEARLRVYEGPNAPSSQTPVYLKANSVVKEDTTSEVKASDSEKPGRSGKSQKSQKTGEQGRRGQKKGHKGATTVRPPDRVQHDRIEECERCHVSLINEDQSNIYGFRKLEIRVITEIVEHQAYRVACPGCAHVSETRPKHRDTIFADNALALIGSLWYDCRVPLNRLCLFLEGITGDQYSQAVVIKGLNVISQNLEDSVREFKQEVFTSDYVGIDETGYPTAINGRSLNWIWVFNTDDFVFYEFAETRGMKELKELWEPPPQEVIPVVDGYPAYNYFPVIGRCWAHLLRLARELAKRCQRGEAVNEQLQQLFHEIKSYRELHKDHADKAPQIIKEGAMQKLNTIIERCKGTMDEGKICQAMSKFAVHLENAKQDLLTGLDHFGLWLTNNVSERNLRKLVIHRKIRGYVASEQGKKTLTNFATVFESWRLQNKNPYQELSEILGVVA